MADLILSIQKKINIMGTNRKIWIIISEYPLGTEPIGYNFYEK